ncbi:MAG TPA: hypothetical protein DCL35_05600 [Candidatus Omnitrophica bacterium]|nr:hypothetical protein [Candidatus Omnitrophota bacterium]
MLFLPFKNFFSILILVSLLIPPNIVFASQSSDVMVGSALRFYNDGYYQEALHEFNKVLLVEPDNEQAKRYILDIRSKQLASRNQKASEILDGFQEERVEAVSRSRDIIINRELDEKSSWKKYLKPEPRPKKEKQAKIKKEKEAKEKTGDYLDIKGEVRAAVGVRSPSEVIWKEANGDLNEKNYRILFGESKHNTFDPAIFDRFRINIDTKNLDEIGVNNINAHANITVDPWSFTGRSDKFTIAGAGGDSVELELKYWSNTAHTINETVYTLNNGDAMSLPEIKVIDGVTSPVTVASTFGNSFVIPATKINRDFMPVREFWVDFKDEERGLRVFPIAYQDQALSTDDPLMLSNRHTWWEESPWLADWRPGNLNTGATPDDFRKGFWDDSLAFFTRDSDGLRLTALRGAAFSYDGVDTKLRSTLASPKNLWADYGEFNTFATATRFSRDLFYNTGIGFTHAGHMGYNSSQLDGLNNVFSMDIKHAPFIGAKVSAQVAGSKSSFDRTDEEFASRKRGYAYIVALVNRFPADDVYEQDYFAINRSGDEDAFLKSRFQAARMDAGFESSLSSYRQTRDDEFWSRHISFRKHPLHLYTGLTAPMSWDDIRTFAVGDGIDSGRDVFGWRLEGAAKLFDRDLAGLFDVRNVHKTNGAFIENVSRLELNMSATDKLTTKFLGINHVVHNTYAGLDPFIFDAVTGKALTNTAIVAGQDPSLYTISAGFDYEVNDKFSYNFVYEHTNDSTVAADNYPRGLFNSASQTTLTENGKVYREPIPFLYSQQYFDLPPYENFDIYKFGFSFRPFKELEFYLDFAFNENKKAGQIDDNMNHYGLEVAYTPTEKLSFLFKYTISRWIDMLELNASGVELYGWHNNFFIESRYRIDPSSEFIFDYGVGGITPLGTASYDPFGGALAVLDTQHIIRVYYKKIF